MWMDLSQILKKWIYQHCFLCKIRCLTFFENEPRPSDPSKWGKIEVFIVNLPSIRKVKSDMWMDLSQILKKWICQHCFLCKIRCLTFFENEPRPFDPSKWGKIGDFAENDNKNWFFHFQTSCNGAYQIYVPIGQRMCCWCFPI